MVARSLLGINELKTWRIFSSLKYKMAYGTMDRVEKSGKMGPLMQGIVYILVYSMFGESG